MLERLESDYEQERKGLVSEAMSLIWASRGGCQKQTGLLVRVVYAIPFIMMLHPAAISLQPFVLLLKADHRPNNCSYLEA